MFKKVSRKFRGHFTEVSKAFYEVSRVFKEGFLRAFFNEVTMVFGGSFNGVSGKFHGCFMKVSRNMEASRKL